MQGRVLIVEDNPDWSKKLKQHLSKEGHKISEAQNYDKALSLIKKRSFDVVVLDLRLIDWDNKDFSGMGLLPEIDKIKDKQGTNVIVLTGYGEVEHARDAFKKHGVYDFLHKGVDEEEEFDMKKLVNVVNGGVIDAYGKRQKILLK